MYKIISVFISVRVSMCVCPRARVCSVAFFYKDRLTDIYGPLLTFSYNIVWSRHLLSNIKK